MTRGSLLVFAGVTLLGLVPDSAGQSANFSTPSLGYVYDKENRTIRPLRGMPGAATVGDALALPFAMTRAAVSSKLSYALGSTEDRSNLVLVRQLDGEVAWSEFENVGRDADVIAVSNSGRSAAVLVSNTIHVLTGLPESASVGRTIDIAGSRVTAIAVSDDARFVVAAFLLDEERPASMLRAYDAEAGAWRDLGPASRVLALSFAVNGRDVAVADSRPVSVSVIRNVEGVSELRPVAHEADGLGAPAAVRFGGDSRLIIATANGVTVVQLNDNSRFDIRCGCVPTALEELGNGSTFRVTDLSREPLWLLNESTDGVQLVFVPPPVSSEPAEEPVQ